MTNPRSILDQAREQAARRDWARVREVLRDARAGGSLTPAELELLGEAERFAGTPEATVSALEEAHAAHAAAGDTLGAARTALSLAHTHSDRSEAGPQGVWLERASALLESAPESAEHALLEWMLGRRHGDHGRLEEHEKSARAALAIASRLGARSVESLAWLDLGHVAVALGATVEGLEQTNRAAALALSGEVGPLETGIVFCGAVWTYRSCGRWMLAEEWTRTADRWSDRERTSYFPGLCRVHRAEVLRARGRLAEAEAEAEEAVRMLEAAIPRWATIAHAELGEVRRRRGDHAGAMEAFRRALELGWEPQPGLALLMLVQGDAQSAHRAMERLFASGAPTWLLEDRTNLLLARARAALAVGATDVARAASAELELLAGTDEGEYDRWELAVAACARGEIALAAGETRAAVDALLQAKRAFGAQATPYELATAGALLADALAADGDARGAQLERDAARAGFERIGAAFDAMRLGGEAREERGVRVEAAVALHDDVAPARLALEGDVVALTFAGRTVRLRRTRGLDHLARLLASPGEEVAALALAADLRVGVSDEAPGGERVDREALAAYRARLAELEEEVDEAREHGDAVRQERAAHELDALRRELAATVGLGGRARREPSAAERARQSVTKALRGAVRKVATEHAALGRHLEASLRTGALCRYDPEHAVAWRISGDESSEVTS